MKGQSF